ncbi:MAG: T9SS C-terminal target domain-containing protein, partial [Sphingobacteriia bacterium]|nr:T9SS C-terminal target domain-containing protein [Sphingobacteriia bacterium]
EAGATNTYYTNGIYLNAGVNYSASVWYQSDFTGATNWSDLSVMVGTAQTIASQSLIASTNGPAVSPIYKSLSGTFSVSTSGMYYVGVKAVGASGAATYLSIDDLRITIPCNDPVNAPALVVGAGASTNVCQGAQVNLVASGANTYSWNTGGTTAAIVVTPNIAGLINYNVIGTNTLSGCAQNVNITLNVKPAPIINAFCIPANVCPGKSANLQASGNGVAAYLWNTGASGAILAVTPSASAVYTVQGTSSNGCLGSQTVAVNVNPTPTITGSASRNQMCLNESVSLSATGGVSYIWSSNNSALVLQGSPANAVAAVTGPASYTVTGTDANGCTGTAIVNVNVEACTGIKAMELGQGLQVYPNPTSGVFALRSQAKVFTAELMDMTGRVIATTEAKDEAVQFNLGGFAAGVYFVKVSSAEGVNIVKVVKQ